MRSSIVILTVLLVACSAVQAQTKLESAGLTSPRTLASRFLDEHYTAYQSLQAKVENKDELIGVLSLMNIAATTNERLLVVRDLYELYATAEEPSNKKLLRSLIAHFCKPYAGLTDADIREVSLMGKLTKSSAWEQNDKMLTDLLAAKKLFEQLPDALAQ